MLRDKIRLIAADMDGTLLNEFGQLPDNFYDIYNRLTKEGVIFAAASGRQYHSLRETFSPIQDSMMFIAENGTLVMHQGKELYSCTMASDAIADIVTLARAIDGAYIVLCGKDSAYIETQDPQALAEIQKYYHRCQYVSDLLTVQDEFIKVAVCHFDGSEKHLFSPFDRQFGQSHKVVISAKFWLDVMDREASKGTAMRHLQETLGFTFEQTMAFGDYLNDAEMLKESYYSYAMENAHAEIKNIATFRAPSNQENGVLTVIGSYLANR